MPLPGKKQGENAGCLRKKDTVREGAAMFTKFAIFVHRLFIKISTLGLTVLKTVL